MSTASTTMEPAGKGDYMVAQGDSIGSIAYMHGLLPETIWSHPDNRELKAARETMDVLLPGDRVTIPELRTQQVSAGDKKRHKFRRKGVPGWLRLQCKTWDEVRANAPYVVEVDGKTFEGTTDGEGRLAIPIVPDAKHATVKVGDPPDVYELDLGTIDPVETMAGVLGRLENLGYAVERSAGASDPATRAALAEFRADHGLGGEDDDPDDAFRDRLVKEHGC